MQLVDVFLASASGFLGTADVASSTWHIGRFAEIFKYDILPASLLCKYVVEHRIDTILDNPFPVFIDRNGDLDVFGQFPARIVSDVWCPASWNIVKDVLAFESEQRLVNVFLLDVETI